MPCRPNPPLAGLLAGIALLASACALPAPFARTAEEPDRSGPTASSSRPVRTPPRKPGPTWATGAPVRVVMNDRFRYRPAAIMVRHTAAAGSGALTVPPGQTKRLTWRFDEPGIILYGCHVLGHWAAGLKGTIVVISPDRPLPLPAISPPGR